MASALNSISCVYVCVRARAYMSSLNTWSIIKFS